MNNIPKNKGKSYLLILLRVSLSIGMLIVLIEVFSYVPPVADNILLATIFGALLYGFGIGIVLSQEGTTGETDILGKLIQYKFPQWKIGKILRGVTLVVVKGVYTNTPKQMLVCALKES